MNSRYLDYQAREKLDKLKKRASRYLSKEDIVALSQYCGENSDCLDDFIDMFEDEIEKAINKPKKRKSSETDL